MKLTSHAWGSPRGSDHWDSLRCSAPTDMTFASSITGSQAQQPRSRSRLKRLPPCPGWRCSCSALPVRHDCQCCEMVSSVRNTACQLPQPLLQTDSAEPSRCPLTFEMPLSMLRNTFCVVGTGTNSAVLRTLLPCGHCTLTPNTLMSSRELVPRRFAPWTDTPENNLTSCVEAGDGLPLVLW